MLLAPMRAHRKGEQQTLLEKCRSQGFIRARINGEVVEIDQPMTLDAKKKHTIEIVIDRLKIKPGIEQRLAESFESAIALTGGLAIVDGSSPAPSILYYSLQNLPAQPVAIALASSNPDCSHSTIQQVPARLAMASAHVVISTPNVSSSTKSSVWMKGPCVAGTNKPPTIISSCSASPITTAFHCRRRGRIWTQTTRKSFYTAAATAPSNTFIARDVAPLDAAFAPLKGSSPVWNAVMLKANLIACDKSLLNC